MRQFISTYESVPYASWNISLHMIFIFSLAVTKIPEILMYFPPQSYESPQVRNVSILFLQSMGS